MLGSFKQFSLAFFTAAVGNVYSLIRVIQYELIFNTSVKIYVMKRHVAYTWL